MKYKMYCIFAKESVAKMNGIRGKMCTQAGHAYLHAFWDGVQAYEGPWWDEENIKDEDRQKINAYRITAQKREQAIAYQNSDHAYKITLIVDTVDELKALQEKYKDICGTSLVTDAGFTVFNEPTTTCLGLGPISEDNIGDDLKALKTFT
jgi:peptidyl-tRNA hydrolase